MARLTLVARKMVVTTIANQAMEPGEAIADNGATKENAREVTNVLGSNPIPKIRKGAELESLADKVEKAQARARGKGVWGEM